MIFILTFCSYVMIHATREGWAILKDKIEDEFTNINSSKLGAIDSTFYIIYGFCLFIAGNLGD